MASTGKNLEDLAGALGISVEALRSSTAGAIVIGATQAFANRYIQLIQRLIENTGSGEYAVKWLLAPHADLGGRAPLDVIKDGYISVIEDLIGDFETGQPG